MTEDQNDNTIEGPASDPNPETPPTETTGQAAIPLPAVTSAWDQPVPTPQVPQTPPLGVPYGATPEAGPTPPAGSTPPQGSYAMGALAGNPMLGAPTASSLGGPPPTNPGEPMWSAPPAPGAGAAGSNHRVRNGLLAGAAALAVLGAGFGIGHATTGNGGSTQAFSPTSGGAPRPRGLRIGRFELVRRLRLLGEPVRQQLRWQLVGQHGKWQFRLVQLFGPQ